MHFTVIIPARLASTRLPRKALADLGGKPMVVRVAERARESGADRVCVATDDQEIAQAVAQAGFEAVMTRADHPTGTDRIAEVVERFALDDRAIVVNIQGDEPLIDPAAIDAAVLGLFEADDVPMGTLKKRIEIAEEITNPNVVKVVTDLSGNAIYFSRSVIPHVRETGGQLPVSFKHIGLYVYRRDFLLAYPDLPIGPLEQSERLEQLRALENGYKIRVVETEYESLGVDTPEDWTRVAELYEKMMSIK